MFKKIIIFVIFVLCFVFCVLCSKKPDNNVVTESMMEVISKSGHTFNVDTSDEECLKFGFESGAKIIAPNGQRYIVAGVAPFLVGEAGHEVLWLIDKNGKAVFSLTEPHEKNLIPQGFQRE